MAMPQDDAGEIIDLQDVRDDESWATDPEKVDTFARHIEQGKKFSTLLVRRVWHEDGSFHYEIIDGFHRYRALVRASVSQHPATVVECDDRTADYDRAQASLDKPSTVLHRRAIRAIQHGFARDMLQYGGNHQLLERVIDESGDVHVQVRQLPITDNPTEALMAVIENDIAQKLDSRRSKYTASEVDEGGDSDGWRVLLDRWLDEMCSWFGVKREWLITDALALSVLELDTRDKGERNIWRTILRIPDTEVRNQLVARVKRERPSAATFQEACAALGISHYLRHTNALYPTATMGKSGILRLLASNTIMQLEAMHVASVRYAQQRQEDRPSDLRDTQDDSDLVSSEAVFSTVSAQFASPVSSPEAEKRKSQVSSRDLIESINALVALGTEYEQNDGDWHMPELRDALSFLVDWALPRRGRPSRNYFATMRRGN